jgi:hypothetical protein
MTSPPSVLPSPTRISSISVSITTAITYVADMQPGQRLRTAACQRLSEVDSTTDSSAQQNVSVHVTALIRSVVYACTCVLA